MSDAKFELEIDPSGGVRGADQFKKKLDELGTAADRAEGDVKQLEQQTAKLGITAKLVGRIAGSLAGAFSIREIIRASDQYKSMSGRLRVVSGDMERFKRAQAEVNAIARQARQPLQGVNDLYVRLGLSAKNNITLQRNLATTVEAVATSFGITGESAATAQGAIVQFAQGLATNFSAAGQEIRSIQEQAPALADAIATGLNEIGVTSDATAGSLNKLAKDGILTTDSVVRALANQIDNLRDKLALVPKTVDQGFTQINNAFVRYIGTSALVNSTTGAIADLMFLLADNFDMVANAVVILSTVVAVRYVAAVVAAQVSTWSWAGAVAALSTAMKAIPLVAVVSAVVLLADKFGGLGSVVDIVALGFFELGVVAAKAATTIGGMVIAAVNAAISPLRHLYDLLRAAGIGLANFIKNPFGGADNFNQLRDVLDKGFTGAFTEAFDNVMVEVGRLNSGMDSALSDFKASVVKRVKDRMDAMAIAAAGAASAVGGGGGQGDGLSGALDDVSKSGDKASDSLKKVKEAADPIAEIFKDTARGIRGTFRDLIRDTLDGNVGIKSFGKKMIDVLKDTIAEMATLALANPVIIPIVAAVGGALGLGTDQIGGVLDQLGGGSGIGSSGIIGGIDRLLGISGSAGAFTGELAGQLADSINQTLFDIGLTDTGLFGGVGQAAVGLGNAAGGFAGTYLGGKVFGEGTGTNIGGTIGAIAGSFIPVPVLGPLVGSFVGSAIGSLFNGKPSSKLQSVQTDLSTGEILGTGGLTGKKFSQQNLDAATSLAQTASALQQIIGSSAQNLSVSVGSRKGLGIAYSFGLNADELARTDTLSADTLSSSGYRDGFKSANAFFDQLIKDLASQTSNLDPVLATAISNIDFGQTEDELQQAIADFDVAAMISNVLKDAEQPIGPLETAMEQLRQTYEDMKPSVERLGIAEETRLAALNKSEQALITAANDNVYDQILDLTDKNLTKRREENARYEAQLKDLQAIGADTAAAEILHKLRLAELQDTSAQNEIAALKTRASDARDLASQYERIGQALDETIFNLRIGNDSPLNPQQKLAETTARFDQLAAEAALGNTASAEALNSLAPTLAGLIREQYSSTEEANNRFQDMQNKLEVARDTAIRQVDLQQLIADNTTSQLQILENGFADLIAAVSGTNAAGQPTNAAGRALTDTGAFGLSVGAIEAIGRQLTGYTGASGSGQIASELDRLGLRDTFDNLLRRAAGIPGYADGGITPANSPYIVGERGPEMLVSPSSARIIPMQSDTAVLEQLETLNRNQAIIINVLRASGRIMDDRLARMGELAQQDVADKRRRRAAQ